MAIVWSRSRLVVKSLMDALVTVRTTEGMDPVEVPYDFGNLSDAKRARPPRLIWKNQGGVVLDTTTTTNPPASITSGPPEAPSTTQAVGYRTSNYIVRIWERDPDLAENLLDELVTASRQVARSDQFVFEKMPWTFITDVEGRWLENGAALIDATVGVRSQVAKEPIGGTLDVVVQGSQFRAGITPLGDFSNPDGTEYEVDTLDGPWPG